MNFAVYQIIVPLFGLVSIVLVIRQHIMGKNTIFETAFWILFWVFVSLIAVFPDPITKFLADTIGIKDHINAIIFTGLALSFFVHFNMFSLIKKQNKTITDLVRKIAVDEGAKEKED